MLIVYFSKIFNIVKVIKSQKTKYYSYELKILIKISVTFSLWKKPQIVIWLIWNKIRHKIKKNLWIRKFSTIINKRKWKKSIIHLIKIMYHKISDCLKILKEINNNKNIVFKLERLKRKNKKNSKMQKKNK